MFDAHLFPRCQQRFAWRCIAALSVVLTSLAGDLKAVENAASPSAQGAEFFELRIRPLLVQHCHECHGAKKQEGSLRLDSLDAVLKGGINGPVIVPGTPEKSRLVEAIKYTNDELQMPPEEQLPAEAVAAIVEWVRLGAPWPAESAHDKAILPAEAWKQHWASQPVHAQPLPTVSDQKWPRSPIDHFVLHKLEQHGLAPSPAADRRTLLRRATFDLIGLPPTLEEITAFEQDTSPDAFARVVDRLLASPRYGERWGRHWLDVARYADTKEYIRLAEERRYLYAFTYRDYVIQAFNDDMPYDQFVTEQLAADLMPNLSDRRKLAALGFMTLGRAFTNNPHDIIDDRIDVVGRGLLGLSLSCARCHDHKYDPIPTADYYSLYGVFANSEVPNVPTLLNESPSDAQMYAHLAEARSRQAELDAYQKQAHADMVHEFRSMTSDYLVATLEGRPPYLVPLPPPPKEVRPRLVERWHDFLDSTERRGLTAFAPWHALAAITPDQDFSQRSREILAELRERKAADPSAKPLNALVMRALEAQTLTSMADVARAYGKLLEDVYLHRRTRVEGQDGENLIINGSFEDDGPTVNTAPKGWRLEGNRFVTLGSEGTTLGSLAAVFGDGVAPSTGHTGVITQQVATRPQTRYRLSFDYTAYGSTAEANAQTLGVKVIGSNSLVDQKLSSTGANPPLFRKSVIDFVADSTTTTIIFSDQTTNNESGQADGVLDDVVLTEFHIGPRTVRSSNSDEDELYEIVAGSNSPTSSITPNEAVDLYIYDGGTHNKIMTLRRRLNDWLAVMASAPPRAHTLVDRAHPLEAFVLKRGDPTRHGAYVPRQFLSAIEGEQRNSFGEGSGRLDLAKAIVSPTNPLTARVLVNRVWQHHFGNGLVRSVSNFGLRGDAPTHSELLDYLAERFMSDGWSIKRLHRSIVLSSTYQQASDYREDGFMKDPENRLLWRMNRQRLDVESLRDAMLMTAGRLDLKAGGPPIDLADSGATRRSVYGRIDRANLPGFLGTFDFASPESHSPLRYVTSVPQQSLFLLNSQFVLRQANALVEREDLNTADTVERINRMYLLAFGRKPDANELASNQKFVETGGTWQELAQVLLLSNEFNFVD
jgi:mono/diheme cytochrome c family protein